MTLQTLQPDQLDSLMRHHSSGSMVQRTFGGVATSEPVGQYAKRQDINDSMMMQHLEQLLFTDSDDRLDYLKELNPAISEDQLDQIALVTERWLDDEARSRMRDAARTCFDDGSDASNTLLGWYTTEEMQRLIDLLSEASIADRGLAMCYAVCEAHDTAYAAYFICQNRARRDIDFGNVAQTPEEIAGDISFVNAR